MFSPVEQVYFGLLNKASKPGVADFWGVNGSLLHQNQLTQVGGEAPAFSSEFSGRRGRLDPPKIDDFRPGSFFEQPKTKPCRKLPEHLEGRSTIIGLPEIVSKSRSRGHCSAELS